MQRHGVSTIDKTGWIPTAIFRQPSNMLIIFLAIVGLFLTLDVSLKHSSTVIYPHFLYHHYIDNHYVTLLQPRSLMPERPDHFLSSNISKIDQGPQSPSGHIYFVSTNGRDTHPGTLDQPFKTIVAGLQVLQPGDTLTVRAGVYAEYLNADIPSGQSWQMPITLKAYPGEVVIIKPPQGSDRVINFTNNQQYIIIDGFVLDGSSVRLDAVKFQAGSNSPAPHHIRLMNSEIKNAPGNGILTSSGSDFLEFKKLTIHDNGTTDFDHGIYMGGSNNLIENCSLFRNAGWGIHLYGGTDNDNIVRNNRSFDNGHVGQRSFGIGIYTGQNNLVYNNLVWGNAQGGINVDYQATKTRIYNNTLFDNAEVGILLGKDSIDTIIKNNIVYQHSGPPLDDSGTNTTNAKNLTSDPQFVNPAAFNFHLRATSPAIKMGEVLQDVPTDFDGILRSPTQYDIGAYEFVDIQGIAKFASQHSQ